MLFLLPIVLVLVFTLSGTGAAETVVSQEGNAVVGAGVTVDDDCFLAGRIVTILGNIKGDTFAAGEGVSSEGKLDGDLFAAGRRIDVRDTVAGNLRLGGQSIGVDGVVGKNAAMAGDQVVLARGSSIAGNVLAAGNSVTANGKIGGIFRAGGDSIIIGGEVGRSVEVSAQNLVILSGAKIEGDVICHSPNPPEIQSGAQIKGTVRHIPLAAQQQKEPAAGSLLLGWISGLAALLVLAAVSILLMPRAISRAAEVIRTKPWASLGWGALGFFAPLPVAILLFATVVGRSLGFTVLFGHVAFLAFSVLLAKVILGLLVGTWILKRIFKLQIFQPIWAILLGAFVLKLLAIIPAVGWIVEVVAAWFAMGALVYLAGISWFVRKPPGGPPEGEAAIGPIPSEGSNQKSATEQDRILGPGADETRDNPTV